MNRKILISAALLVTALSVYAAGRDPVTIVWKPKSGDVFKYTQKLNGKGGIGEFVFTMDVTSTVKAINPDQSVVVEDKTTNGDGTFNGNPVPSGAVPDETITTTSKADGSLISQKSDPPTPSTRSNVFSQFIYPATPKNVGDTWQHTGKADKAAGTNDYEIDYTYKGQETQDGIASNRIDITFKEMNVDQPITGDGTLWLDKDTGSLVKISVKMKNVDSPAGAIDVEVLQDRKS